MGGLVRHVRAKLLRRAARERREPCLPAWKVGGADSSGPKGARGGGAMEGRMEAGGPPGRGLPPLVAEAGGPGAGERARTGPQAGPPGPGRGRSGPLAASNRPLRVRPDPSPPASPPSAPPSALIPLRRADMQVVWGAFLGGLTGTAPRVPRRHGRADRRSCSRRCRTFTGQVGQGGGSRARSCQLVQGRGWTRSGWLGTLRT